MTSTARRRPATAYRLFEVAVLRTRRLSPSFTRFTFVGGDLDAFADNGFDQRIKLVLPLPGVGLALPDGDDWFARWRLLPDGRRNPIRTYTARAVRQAEREVDVDVVLHGESGPASRWATQARPGDRVTLLGPNAEFEGDCGGIEFDVAACARPLLLVGDETAVPAIASILERLPASVRGEVLLEVPDADDALDLRAPDGVTITWIARAGASRGELLVPAVQAVAERLVVSERSAVRSRPAVSAEPSDDLGPADELLWEVPAPGPGSTSDELYAWLAGEAGVITSLRRHLVRGLGVDRRSVAFMGYWKLGRAES
jgi:NADPH-dependent ferric siderophore reductase